MTFPAVVIQAWPRSMMRDQACAYCSARADELPPPSYGSGRTGRWLKDDLDMWLDRKAGRVDEVSADAWIEAAGR